MLEKELRKTIKEFRLFAFRVKGHRVKLSIWEFKLLEIAFYSLLAWFVVGFLIFKLIEIFRYR